MPFVNLVADFTKVKIVEPLPYEVNQYIDSKTRFHPNGYDKRFDFIRKRWDGYDHTYDTENQLFRIGLLERVTKALKFMKYEVVVSHTGKEEWARIDVQLDTNVIRPYDFQAKCRQIAREHDIGIIASPTGTGKSVAMGLMIDELKRRTLMVFNDLVLCDQMERNLKRYFPKADVGYIGNAEFKLGDIVVATVQSLSSILGLIKRKKAIAESENKMALQEWLKGVGLVTHDEAHLADADTSIALYDLFTNIPKRFGFSATPEGWSDKVTKTANVELEQVFGHVIYSTFDIDFVKLGLKAPCIVRNIEVPAQVKVYGTFRDNQGALYKKCLDFEILHNPVWHQTVKNVVDEYRNSGSSVFVYAAHSIAYGEMLAKKLDAPFVQGKTPRKERFRLFDALQKKEILCLVSDIGGIGLDIPSLDCFVLASDAKDIRQMAGRVTRASPNKQEGYFIDLWTDCSFMKSHHQTRINQYNSVVDAVQLGA